MRSGGMAMGRVCSANQCSGAWIRSRRGARGDGCDRRLRGPARPDEEPEVAAVAEDQFGADEDGFIASLPLILIFLFTMRLFVRGLSQGAIKG